MGNAEVTHELPNNPTMTLSTDYFKHDLPFDPARMSTDLYEAVEPHDRRKRKKIERLIVKVKVPTPLYLWRVLNNSWVRAKKEKSVSGTFIIDSPNYNMIAWLSHFPGIIELSC